MKRFQRLLHILVLLSMMAAVAGCSVARPGNEEKQLAKEAEVRSLIETKKFVFKARSATPTGGRVIQLSPEYDIRLSGDSLTTFLPYFGRAFSAPANPSEGGIKLTSTNFTYNINSRKRGGWDIQMLPADSRDVRELLLSVTESGYATLRVLSNNRQAITFEGYIEGVKNIR